LKLQLQSLEVRHPDDLEVAFQAARKGRAEALVVSAFGFFNTQRARIANLGAKTRLPVMYSSPFFVTEGGLMYYGPEIAEQFRRAAIYVDKILKGTKPADLPVEQPKKFELIISIKTAKQIGITIPPNVLARADKVIR
jgi:putative ABC transport system substrate-binding protein